MKFSAKYDKFIELCRGKIPAIQVQGLNERPKINPIITPTPRDWFVDSFDWYVALKLLRGKVYGPFYRIDGDFFWPTIGNMYDIYSETKCFFGLEKPKTPDDGRLLYNIRDDTDSDYVYEISIEMPAWPIVDDAYIFLGAVKDGKGFQINPNGRVVELLRERILNNKIKRFTTGRDGRYDYNKGEVYFFTKNGR